MKKYKKQLNNFEIIIKRILLSEIKKNKQLLNDLINYIYDYFYNFENIKLDKSKLANILLRKFKDKNNLYFIIKKNNSNIGIVHTYISNKYIDLCLIYLDKQFRGEGIGIKVIEYLRKYFQQKYSKTQKQFFRIEVKADNFRSHKFFQKLKAKTKSIIYLLKI